MKSSKKERKVVIGYNSDNRVHYHRRSRSPDERLARTIARTMRTDGIDQIVRKLPPARVSLNHPPNDPHASWLASTVVDFWIDWSLIPEGVNLTEPRVGRAFVWQQLNIALFPACPANPLCPPYPGVIPTEVEHPFSHHSCFSDGKGGRFDPRDCPQLFRKRRPWMGYYEPPYAKDDKRYQLDYLPATSFYHWSLPGHPWLGGQWKHTLVTSLLSSRSSMEGWALSKLEQLEKAMGAKLDLSEYDLPWEDCLEWEDTRKWMSWADGRDAIARTCKYIAELRAFAWWAHYRRVQITRPRGDTGLEADTAHFMGTWASSDMSAADWLELYHAQVPVYIASVIPDGHDLLQTPLDSGGMDADEIFRESVYDTVHGWHNARESTLSGYSYSNYPGQDCRGAVCIPATLRQPVPLGGTGERTSWNRSWTSYIYQDPNITRLFPSITQQHLKFRRESHLLAPFLPPGQRVLKTELALHPFFLVCDGAARDKGVSHYKEVHDVSLDIWWFEKVRGQRPLKAASKMAYIFSYPTESIVIHSDHGFPGRNPLFCRISKDRIRATLAPIQTRKYVKEKPKSGEEVTPSFQWDYEGAEVSEMIDQDGNVAMQDGTLWSFPPDDLDPGVYDDAPGIIPDPEILEEPEEHMDLEERCKQLLHQREEVFAEMDRRLFLQAKQCEELRSALIPWDVPGTSTPTKLWPLRISNLHGDVKEKAVIAMLVDSFGIRKVDILLFSAYREVDTTMTVDVGLRHVEDVLWLELLLNGVKVDGRLLDVFRITAILSKAMSLDVSSWAPLDADKRMKRWSTMKSCRKDMHPHGAFTHHLKLFEEAACLYRAAPITSETESMEDFVISLPSLLQSTALELQLQLDEPRPLVADPVSDETGGYIDAYREFGGSISWDEITPAPPVHPPQAERHQGRSSNSSGSKPYDRHPNLDHRSSKDETSSDNLRSSGTSGKRRVRHQKVNRKRGTGDPHGQENMQTEERRRHRHALHHRAYILQCACRIELPQLNLPPNPVAGGPVASTIKMLETWWDWLDECRDLLDGRRHENPGEYDWSIVDIVFGHSSKLRGLYGKEYRFCLEALQKRPPWHSKFVAVDSASPPVPSTDLSDAE